MIGNRRHFAATIGSVVLLGTGCSSNHRTSKTSGISAVATVGMVADLVRNVLGAQGYVTQLMGAGIDPHLYQATRDDVAIIMAGDIVFYSGLLLEGRMTHVLSKLAERELVYAVTDAIEAYSLLKPEDTSEHIDPHVWMDVSKWNACVPLIARMLSKYRPELQVEFASRATEYQASLAKLHEYGKQVVATIPERSRVLITSHDAFNYFGQAYGLEVVGVQGMSTESEAGLQQINGLVDMLVEREVRAVFVESSVSQKNIRALIDGARSRGHAVTIGGELFSDAMGPEGTYEGTYIGMLDHNLTLVTRALGGQAPERGLHNKLTIENRE